MIRQYQRVIMNKALTFNLTMNTHKSSHPQQQAQNKEGFNALIIITFQNIRIPHTFLLNIHLWRFTDWSQSLACRAVT